MNERIPVHCLACGEPMLPRLDECFVCPASNPAPRRVARYRVTDVTEDVEGLARAFDGLALAAPAKPSFARQLVGNPPFDVLLEGTELQHSVFVDLLSGAKHDLVSADAPPVPDSLRWVGRPLAWKLAVTGAIGAVAIALETTSVLLASIGIVIVLAGRGVSFVPRLFTPAREAIDSSLDLLAPRDRAAYRAARATLSEARTIQALDRFVALVVAARAEARARGSHLRDADVRRLDLQLGRVLRDLCAAIARAPRASMPDAAATYRQASIREREGGVSTLLAEAGRALREAMEVPGAGARAGLLARYVPV